MTFKLRSLLSTAPLLVVLACSNTNEPAGPGGGTGGARSGGSDGRGGSGGASAMGGTGGATSGSGGGPAGSGGTPGAGSGGAPGGSGGTPGAGGGSGSGGTTGDAGADTSKPDMTTGGPSLDQCFMGLRTLSGSAQLATKRSSDGKYEVRLAIEVDGFGTSGTKAWRLIRIGVVTPEGNACVSDENALRQAYKASHHNCSDTLTVTTNGRTYELKAPDTHPGRGPTTLTVITGGTRGEAIPLPTVTCTPPSGGECRSGQPC